LYQEKSGNPGWNLLKKTELGSKNFLFSSRQTNVDKWRMSPKDFDEGVAERKKKFLIFSACFCSIYIFSFFTQNLI
jgi:hypothetical protein